MTIKSAMVHLICGTTIGCVCEFASANDSEKLFRCTDSQYEKFIGYNMDKATHATGGDDIGAASLKSHLPRETELECSRRLKHDLINLYKTTKDNMKNNSNNGNQE